MGNLFPLIPLSIAILFTIKVVVIYILALCFDHVKPFFPYLSDAGATHPEAGFFSILLILEAILVGIFGWIRYKQIRYVCAKSPEFSNNNKNEEKTKKILKYNKYGLYLSVIAMLGMGAVAAFRSTEHLELHLVVGANPAFFGIFLYYMTQVWLSFNLKPTVNTILLARIRLIITIMSGILGIIMFAAIIAMVIQVLPTNKLTYDELRSSKRLLWDQSLNGYYAHGISAIAENLMIWSVTPFYLTFFWEFRRIKSHNGQLKYQFIGQTENIPI